MLGTLVRAQEPGPRFSHSVHLQTVGLACVQCHTSAPESRSTGDVNLPKAEVCASCHLEEEGDMRGRGSDFVPEVAPRPVLFSHQRHIGIQDLTARIVGALESGSYPEGDPAAIRKEINAEEACSACHRGLKQAALGTRENYPLMSDCLVCHQPKGNAMAECRTCHVRDFDLLPPDHRTATFFDNHSSGSQKQNAARCRQCHTPRFNPCTQCH